MKPESKRFSKPRQALGLIASIAICFAAAGIGGLATNSSVNNWYLGIVKPSWNPPAWVFAPVWSVLYLMMAIAAWLVWKNSGFGNSKWALGWFAIQLALNVLWSILFFGLRQPGWAAVEIVALWLSIAVTIGFFYRHSKLASSLLVPYLMWVAFAAFLTFAIWSLNRGL